MTRPALHAAAGLGALTLRFLDPVPAAGFAALLVAHNLFLFPRYAPRVMRPPGPRADVGVVSYPLVVLAFVVAFASRPDFAAAAWAILAFGDAAAAWVGSRVRGWRIPWNSGKHVSGMLAFVVAGGAGAWAVVAFVSASPGQAFAAPARPDAVVLLVAAAAAAVAESLRARLVDNVRIGVALIAVFGAAAVMDPARAHAGLAAARDALPWATAVGLGGGAIGIALGAFTLGGAAAGGLLAAAVFAAGRAPALAVLAAFVVAGAAATRIGRHRKEALGVAQPARGRRGAASVAANGALAGGLAIAAAGSEAAAGLWLAFAGALATAAFDTVATEIGQAFGGAPRLFPSGRPAPPGTPGAVSVAGTVSGALAALLVAGVAAGAGVVPRATIPAVVAAGAIGAFLESAVAANPGARAHLGPHARNALNTVGGAVAAVLLGWHSL